MAKSTHFFGQSVFGQLIDLIDPSIVSEAIRQTNSDRYYKRFHTWDHLISMLFGGLAHCTSLREISGAMMGFKGKLEHFKLTRVPRRSTLSDANRRRSADVFCRIYYGLLKRYRSILSDSRFMEVQGKKISIIDSTTIALFKAILKTSGLKSSNGKRKGGIKVHTEMLLHEQVPQLVWYTAAAKNDVLFLQKVDFKKENIYVFDRGYIHHEFYEKLNTAQVGFVSRMKENATYQSVEKLERVQNSPEALLHDEKLDLPIRVNGKIIRTVSVRRIVWWDQANNRVFNFITNLFELEAQHVASIYKMRWQIELLFKQLKQNFPLKYFLGDTENAITVQIWCTLITNLLLTVIKRQLTRRTAFSCIASHIRVNLINYIHIIRFLNNPDKDWSIESDPNLQQSLFQT
jgi:hypothetical protein